MNLLEGAVRNYDWGSRTAIPDFLGRPRSDAPVAELWFGAHPGHPSTVGAAARPLDEAISDDIVGMLGAEIAAQFETLPFLFKVIAVAAPLSLQAHPTAAQSIAGYDRENAAGIAVDAPERFFRDRTHKPELICALTPFRALCGFRDPHLTLDLLAMIDTAALDPVREHLTAAPDRHGLRAALTWLLTLDAEAAESLTAAVVAACSDDTPAPASAEREQTIGLAELHPKDAGVVIALLLNQVSLDPGEALFLGPGVLHSYLSGMGVELMANSDNVLRGGLTSKPVDVASLLDIVDTGPARPSIQRPDVVAGVALYDSPTAEFSLRRLEIDEQTQIEVAGPAVLLCVGGAVDAGPHTLDRGSAAWIPASDPPIMLSGRGTVFRAGVGRLGSTLTDAEG